MRVNFGDQAYRERSVNLNSQELVNFFAVPGGPSAKDSFGLYGTPGLLTWVNLGAAQLRGFRTFGNTLYVTYGNSLYEISAAGVATNVGTLDSSVGRVAMSDNGTQVIIVTGGTGYTYNTSTTTFAAIADPDFPATARTVTYVGGYFIVTEVDSQKWYVSGLNDGTTWSALDFATAEYTPDNLQTAAENYGELWLFGDESTEVWSLLLSGTFPFTRLEGSKNNWGCISRFSVARVENQLIWLGNPPDGGTPQVVINSGYQAIPISTPAMDYEIATYSVTADAYAYAYKDEGHQFYVITFPSANVTWAFDFLTKRWHKRSSKVNGDYLEHNSLGYVYFAGKHLVSSVEDGKIYEMSLNYYTEDGRTIRRQVTSPPIFDQDNNRLLHDRLQLDFEAGTGTNDIDPTVMLEWSNDSGHSYGGEIWRTVGKPGEYDKRATWHQLGSARTRVYRMFVTDPVAWRLVSANIKMRQCRT
jgi:hypothetical protein